MQSVNGYQSNTRNNWTGNTMGRQTNYWRGDLIGTKRGYLPNVQRPKKDWRASATEGKPKAILVKRWRRKRQNGRNIPDPKDVTVCPTPGNWIVPSFSFAFPPPPFSAYHPPTGFPEPPPNFSDPIPSVISEPEVMDISTLLNKLEQNGLIGLAATKSKIPEISLERSHPSLKTRYPEVISQLYEKKPSQCKICSKRFSVDERPLYRSHLDWHFIKNHNEKGAKDTKSRGWYCNAWEEDSTNEVINEKKSDKIEEKAVTVGEGEEGSQCPKCCESFELFYSEDEEDKSQDNSLWNDELSRDGQWFFRNALRIGVEVYHPQCYKEDALGKV